MADVVEHLYNKEINGKVVIDDQIKAAIDAYISNMVHRQNNWQST